MKKLNDGFSLIIVLVTLLIIGMLGGIGWYIMHDRSNSGPVTKVADVDKETADWKSLSKFGITFKYPKDWILHESPNDPAVIVTSPEIANLTEVRTKGEGIRVSSSSLTKEGTTALNFKENYFGADASKFSDYKILDIHGEKAVQFMVPEGDQMTLFFAKKDETVEFTTTTYPPGTTISDTAKTIIASVEFE